MTDGFNACENVVCNFTEGAMYSFPQVKLPNAAVAAARQSSGCLLLLEASGSDWNLHCARIRIRSERRVLISHHSDSIAGFFFESIVSRVMC